MSNLEEKKLDSKEYYRNSFLYVHEDDVLLPDGNESKRIVVTHVGAVNVIALTKELELLLVKQYRYPLGVTTIETPAGKLEEAEAPIITAKRELEEETGYTCSDLIHLGTHASAPGFTNELLHQYLAVEVAQLDELVSGDADEFTEVVKVNKEDALKMVENGEIFDLKTVYAINYLCLTNKW